MKTQSELSLFATVNKLNVLIDNLLVLLTEKEKNVIVKRFNLDGSGRYTLDSIGKAYGITRERVRQIEKNALGKMSRNVSNVGFSAIHNFMGEILDDNAGYTTEENLYNELISSIPDDSVVNAEHLHLAFVLNENVKCVGNTVNFFPYIRRSNISDSVLKNVSSNLIKELNSRKAVTEISEVSNIVSAFKISGSVSKVVKSLVKIDKRIALIEDSSIALMSWRHVRPRTLRDKILYVLRNVSLPMHFRDISAKISSLNFDDRKINVQAVHNELIRCDSFILIGRGIYALADWGYQKGTVADVIVDLFKDVSEMSRDDIVEKVLAVRHVKKITVILALKNGKRFERVGRNFYKLVK